MKKIILSLLGLFLFVFGYCYDFPNYKNNSINDFSNVIQNPIELNNVINEVNQKNNIKITVVSIDNLPNGVSIEEYTKKLADFWQVGSYDNRGIMILFSIGDRKSRISIGKDIANIITNEVATNAANQMRPYFRQNDFDEGVKQSVFFISDYIIKYNQELNSNSPIAETPIIPIVEKSNKESSTDWVNLFYVLILLSVCTIGYLIYYSYNNIKEEKLTKYKDVIETKNTALNKLYNELKICLPNNNALPIINNLSVSQLLANIKSHIDYYNLLNISSDRVYSETQFEYFDKIDIKQIKSDVETFVKYHYSYESNKYKTNAEYISKIESQVNNINSFFQYIKGEFLDKSAVETFNSDVLFYTKEINNIVIDKTNFVSLESSIKKLESCLTYFKKNAFNVLYNKLIEGKSKTEFIENTNDRFDLLIKQYKSLTNEVWCLESTKEKVLQTLIDYTSKFSELKKSYTYASYKMINDFFEEIKNHSVIKLLDADKNDFYQKQELLRKNRNRSNRNNYNNNHYSVSVYSHNNTPSIGLMGGYCNTNDSFLANDAFGSGSNDSFSSGSNDSFGSFDTGGSSSFDSGSFDTGGSSNW